TADLNAIAKDKAMQKANLVFGVNGSEYRRNSVKMSPEDQAKKAEVQKKIDKILERMPDPLPVADGVRDGDYRLTPDGLGDSHIPGTGRPVYDVKCCFVPEPDHKYVVPPVYFAAASDDVKSNESTFQVQPGFLSVLKDMNMPATDPPKRPGYQTS